MINKVHIVVKPMVILQFQFTNIDEDDLEIIQEFCDFIIDSILVTINKKINLKKINARMKYLYNDVNWIDWFGNKKYDTSALDLIQTVNSSLRAVSYKANLWKIEVNSNILIPNSSTSIDRFIRYLNYGDAHSRATGIFTDVENYFNHSKLNSLWCYFNLKYGHTSNAKIIAK